MSDKVGTFMPQICASKSLNPRRSGHREWNWSRVPLLAEILLIIKYFSALCFLRPAPCLNLRRGYTPRSICLHAFEKPPSTIPPVVPNGGRQRARALIMQHLACLATAIRHEPARFRPTVPLLPIRCFQGNRDDSLTLDPTRSYVVPMCPDPVPATGTL